MSHSKTITPSNSFGLVFVFLFIGRGGANLLKLSISSLRRAGYAGLIRVYTTIEQIESLSGSIADDVEIVTLEEIPNFGSLYPNLSTEYSEWGSQHFNTITSIKWLIILQNIRDGFEVVVFSDFDIFYLKNPENYILLVMKDFRVAIQSESLAVFPPAVCTGFMVFSKRMETLIGQLLIASKKFSSVGNDQHLFNHVLATNPGFRKDVFILPESLFCNGLHIAHFKNRDPVDFLKGSLDPFIFHANYVLGIAAKERLMRLAGLYTAEFL